MIGTTVELLVFVVFLVVFLGGVLLVAVSVWMEELVFELVLVLVLFGVSNLAGRSDCVEETKYMISNCDITALT